MKDDMKTPITNMHRFGRLPIGFTAQMAAALFLSVLAIGLQPTFAQTTCINQAGGVPGLPAGADVNPNWYGGGQPPYANKLDDPRWRGAGQISHGSGTVELASLRCLYTPAPLTFSGPANLYLSWRVLVAPASNATENNLYVGFRQAGGGDLIIKVTLTSLTPASASNNRNITVFTRNPDGSGTAAPSTPTWLNDTKVWVNDPDANSFAVEMRVPLTNAGLTSGVNVDPAAGSNFKMWYELLAGTPGAAVFSQTWPPGTPVVDGLNGDTYPDPAGWREFRLSTGPGDAGCGGDVSLERLDVGTLNNPTSQINLNSPNTFVAHPKNESSTNTIPASTIKARFRIANWGSQPIAEQVADPDTLWQTIPGGAAVTHPAAIAAGAKGDISFPWTLTAAERAQFPPIGTARRLHQCMLVELSGAGLTFKNASVCRNMDFASASSFKDEAEISVVGLTAPDPARNLHDVYLYVEKLHMPKDTKPGTIDPTMDPNLVKEFGSMSFERMNSVIRSGALTPDQLDRFMPAYRVHAFHDTGKKIRISGTAQPLLEPQTSFGYYVKHDGELYGWDTELVGAKKIAENFYKLEVRANGTALIRTAITALEQPRKRCCFSANMGTASFFLLSLGILGMVVLRPSKTTRE
jgi:hypothetical protein